jgi:hypothetical protein
MRSDVTARATALGLEELEGRLVPSGTSLLQESFDTTWVGGLPSGWSQWASDGSAAFAVSSAQAFAGPNGLASTAASGVSARAWASAQEPADLQTTAAVYVDSLVPTQVLARGSNLASSTPTYYAVSVTRGLTVQLVRVVDGVSTTLGQVNSASWFQWKWAQVTLSAVGSQIQAQVYRPDTGQYLNSSGQWQSSQAWALSVSDGAISGGGYAGLARAAGYADQVSFDSFSVTGNGNGGGTGGGSGAAAGQTETFDSTASGSLPSGWSQWGSDGSSFAVSGSMPENGPNGLASWGASSMSARGWLATSQPANVQASIDAYVNSLTASQVLVRGSNLNTDAPTYYALTVQRGLYAQLVRVVNGVSTTLASVSSASWFDGQWLRLTLTANGSQLQGQLYRTDTGQYLNSSGQWQAAPTSAFTVTDWAISGAGYAGVGRMAGYAGNVYFDNFSVAPLGGAAPSPPPPSSSSSIPQHYNWIRIAELAYSGTPLGWYEDQLLRSSVDLVVTDTGALSQHINQVAPNTPQLGYMNYSSLYGSLLLDWDNWADAHGVSREAAFLHVTQPTAFSGDSPSSQPVSWFWAVYQGGSSPNFTDMTESAHIAGSQSISLGGAGTSTYIGFPEQFGQVNFNLASAASGGWSAVLEYPTAVDGSGNPTAWAAMPQSNSTAGFTRSGQITFTPPSNWQTSSVNGSARMYFVRLRVVSGWQPPVANTILGADYVGAWGGTSGTIPAPGQAQFAYQSRLFYASYGQMRFATNPSNPYFRRWAIDYTQRYLAAHPYTAGLFVDNSGGSPLVSPGQVAESVWSYSADYGSLLNSIGQAIAPHWLMANTSGAGLTADPVVTQTPGYFEEFALRPLSGSYMQFEDLAAVVAHRAALQSPAPYAVLDALPAGGSATDPRTQIATLAEYYLLADSTHTFLDPFGGDAPATSWSQHFFNAITYNVGQPRGSWSLLSGGLDPNDNRFTYRVYARQYDNALVLYKPLSSTSNGSATGSNSNNTATWQALNGTYRALQADGTLGPPVTGVTLRNGEGAILVRA